MGTELTQTPAINLNNSGAENNEIDLKNKKRRRKRLIKRIIKAAIALLVILGLAFLIFKLFFDKSGTTVTKSYTTSEVERRTITNELSASGTITALNEYNITTLVKGEIIKADFEVGDYVEADQVLYQIATDEVDAEIETAETTLKRANESYEKAQKSYTKAVTNHTEAVEDYDEALADLETAKADYDEAAAALATAQEAYDNAAAENGDLSLKSDYSGLIKKVNVEAGDSIQKGQQLAEIVNSDIMTIKLQFPAASADKSLVGKTAEIEISGAFETISGTVTAVANETEIGDGNAIVRTVTIEVKNPGGITTSTVGNGTIGNIESVGEANFDYSVNTTITSPKSGKIVTLKLTEDEKITAGDVMLTFDGDDLDGWISDYVSDLNEAEKEEESALQSYENAQKTAESAKKSVDNALDSIDSAQDSIDSAKETIEDAETNLEDKKEALDDCYITAPVAGKVIRKNMLVGDIIGTSNFSSTLAVIYDLSAVTFEMSIDELDIMSVENGQEVAVTADALDGTFSGVVSNVSLVSTSSGGVTSYPVTVRIDEVGDLLPGMNVTGAITLEAAENVLTVPVDAVQRGNVVYVKDDETASSSSDSSDKNTKNDNESAANTADATSESDGDTSAASDEEATKSEKPQMPTGGEMPEMPADGEMPEMPADGEMPEMPSGFGEKSDSTDSSDSDSASSGKSAKTSSDSDVPEGFHAVNVTTGLSDGDYIQVEGDLEEGDEVYIVRYSSETSSDSAFSFDFGGMSGMGGNSGSSGFSGFSGGSSGGRSNSGGMPSGGMPGGF